MVLCYLLVRFFSSLSSSFDILFSCSAQSAHKSVPSGRVDTFQCLPEHWRNCAPNTCKGDYCGGDCGECCCSHRLENEDLGHDPNYEKCFQNCKETDLNYECPDGWSVFRVRVRRGFISCTKVLNRWLFLLLLLLLLMLLLL